MKTTTPPVRNFMSHSSRECRPIAGLLIPLVLVCFALLPRAQALLPPPAPDGGYPGNNTAEGTNALFSLTTGFNNTAVGTNALLKTTNGSYNAGFGSRALENNIHGNFNMAVGTQALFKNTADSNMAVGFRVLFNNTTGNNLTGIGAGALFSNTTGNNNTAIGAAALSANTTGTQNTATGRQALFKNIAGIGNTANGFQALFHNIVGSGNTANGEFALLLSTGDNNTALGVGAGSGITTADNVIAIGTAGQDVSNSCYIGQIFGAASSGGTTVLINSDGKLGTNISSRRFKEEIKPMEDVSEVLFALKPVTFRYKQELDPNGIPQFGLVAEDVEEVNPDLVVRDKEGKVNTVRYEAVNAMLLNEFLKEHRKVQEQEATIAELKCTTAKQEATAAQQQKEIQALTARLEEQESQIQKVSAQLEVKKPAPRTALNNQ